MIKIECKVSDVDTHFQAIKKLFINDILLKKENNKILWKTTYIDIEKIIKHKFSKFDANITFEKLIKADYKYMQKLIHYINTHKNLCELSQNEKRYFLELYTRLKKPTFIKRLNVQVCPYCNRNYIFNFSKNNNQEATGQLDHFFDKTKYSYLAVSFYNLVPSCSTCNQRKSTKQKNIFYPYSESFHESAKFRYDGIEALKIDEKLPFFDSKRVILNIEAIRNKDKVKKHIKVFNIDNIYENHKDIVSELLQKREIYPDSYIDELAYNYSDLFKNREDLLRLITCGYIEDKDLDKRPLSKLIKDISEELNLI